MYDEGRISLEVSDHSLKVVETWKSDSKRPARYSRSHSRNSGAPVIFVPLFANLEGAPISVNESHSFVGMTRALDV